MSRLVALVRREFESYVLNPVPWVLTFFFLLLTWFFFALEISGSRGYPVRVTYTPVFVSLDFILMFLMPLLTMSSVADERSRNTLETLLTAPVQDWQVILSKWLGTFLFFVLMLFPTLVYWLVLRHIGEPIGKPDPGPIATAYFGALLLGGLYAAIGIFASSLTENALMSAFLSFFLLIFLIAVGVLPFVQEASAEWVRLAATYLSPHDHFEAFLRGRIETKGLVYFGSTTALFLFFAVRSLESRKWR